MGSYESTPVGAGRATQSWMLHAFAERDFPGKYPAQKPTIAESRRTFTPYDTVGGDLTEEEIALIKVIFARSDAAPSLVSLCLQITDSAVIAWQ